tara:strand:- start:17 stop:421 length:405 start_codon:yes stop_codon:yes gene_type:complete
VVEPLPFFPTLGESEKKATLHKTSKKREMGKKDGKDVKEGEHDTTSSSGSSSSSISISSSSNVASHDSSTSNEDVSVAGAGAESINELLRMKYRFLELRGQKLQHNLRTRSKVTVVFALIRSYYHLCLQTYLGR